MTSVVLVTTQPLFVALASPFLLRERPGRRILVGIAIAGFGAALMAVTSGGSSGHSFTGYAFAVLGAMFAAAYFMIGRHLQRTISLRHYIGIVYPTAAAALVLAALASGTPLFGYGSRTFLMFGLLALVPQLIGHSSLNWALRYLPAAVVTVAVLGEPVGATVLAALLLAERPTLQEAAGAVIVLLGVWLALQGASRAAAMPEESPGPGRLSGEN
jgi:drug/metabolite transporter (DMT)-like permease